MPRISVLVSVVAVGLLGLLLATQPAATTAAQEGTPPAEEEFELPEGVSFEGLGYGTTEELPAAPADLSLFRFGLEPGASFDLDPEASVALVYVEEGALTFVVDDEITVLRAAGEGTPFPEETETVAAGEEFVLEEGDSAVFPAGGGGEVRNDGDEPARVLVADVFPAQGGEEGAAAEGTPAG